MNEELASKKFDSIERPKVAALDEILGHSLQVLDDGFVRLVDYMGSDDSIVQAARVSYGKGTKRVSQDRGLIRYLMRNWHTTPFEMCELKLHVRVPMDCWRQWIRHRTANVNEYSTRYSEAIDSAQRTAPDQWRQQLAGNRQGSGSVLSTEVGQELSRAEEHLHQTSREIYEQRLRRGVAREQARKDLPLSTFTEAYWKIDLHNLFHFLMLRLDPHAQLEIRSYANVIGNEIVSRWCPVAWEAFVDYRLKATTLTRYDFEIVRALAGGRSDEAIKLAIQFDLISQDGQPTNTNRERNELELKLQKLGFTAPWAIKADKPP